MLTGKRLQDYLAYTVHGIKKPPGEARMPQQRKGKPRKGPARDEAYKAWIRTLPSVISGCAPCDACHTGSDGGMSMKASDDSCVPMTREEHQEYHRIGKRAFEQRYGIRFAVVCKRLLAEWRGRAA